MFSTVWDENSSQTANTSCKTLFPPFFNASSVAVLPLGKDILFDDVEWIGRKDNCDLLLDFNKIFMSHSFYIKTAVRVVSNGNRSLRKS
jgi:hypothetical protein